jgi:hypothetical protein
VKINGLIATDGGLGFDILDGLGGHAADYGMSGDIPGDHGAGGDHRALADAHAVGDDGAGPEPDIVFDEDAFGSDALLGEGLVGVVKDMVHGDDLGEGGGVDAITNVDAALAANDGVFADQAVAADGDASVGEVTEVVDVEDSAVHDDGIGSDCDAVGTGVQVGVLVEVSAVAEMDVVGEAQADAVLDGGPAVHVEDEAVEAASQANAYYGRDPAEEGVEGLFEDIASEAGGLAVEVEA